MIVENGSVTMQLDLNGLNGSGSLVATASHIALRCGAPILSFPFSCLTMYCAASSPARWRWLCKAPLRAASTLPTTACLPLSASLKRLTVEKLPSGQGFDLAVRDSNTGFTFFNIEGHQYDYDAGAQSLTITGGRLLLSKQFASALGLPSEAGSSVGTISIGAAMQPIEINQLVNGKRNRW